MKKPILFFALLIILFSCKSHKDSDTIKDNLKGDVIGIINVVYKASYKFGELTKTEVIQDLGQTNYVKKYNKDGNLEEHLVLFGLEPFWIWKYHFNEKGLKDFDELYEVDGKFDGKNKYEYNSNEKEIQRNDYDENGNLSRHFTSSYDELGRLKEEKLFLKNENIMITQYEYKGDSVMFVNDINSDNIVRSYDKFLNGKKVESKSKDELKRFSYNKYGDISKEYIYQSFDAPCIYFITYEYKYDKFDNWIELKKYVKIDKTNNILPFSITNRTIIYRNNNENITAESIYNNSNYKIELEQLKKRGLENKYCNESAVIYQVTKKIENGIPNYTVIPSSIKVSDLGNCKYEVSLVIQHNEFNDIKKIVVLELEYLDNFQKVNIVVKQESSY